jgi:hypothetical protein
MRLLVLQIVVASEVVLRCLLLLFQVKFSGYEVHNL